MKWSVMFSLFLVSSIVIVGCNPFLISDQMKTDTRFEVTSTRNITPLRSLVHTPTVTLTPLPTLTVMQRDNILEDMISKPIDCAAPCLLGVTPGRTTSAEVIAKIRYFGQEPEITVADGKTTSSFYYELPIRIHIAAEFDLEENIVSTITFILTLNPIRDDLWKDSCAYSPATLIKRYGQPSRVEFAASLDPTHFFSMVFYFDQVDLIVEYFGQNINGINKSEQICPLNIKFDEVTLWLGNKPDYPPNEEVSLKDLSSLSILEFSNLLTGDPSNACFKVNSDLLLGLIR